MIDYLEDLGVDIASGALYGLVGIALLAVGFFVIDMITPGQLGRQLIEDRNRNAGIVVSASLLAVGIIVTSAILASEGSLSKGLGQAAGFGLVGILLLAIAFAVLDVLTPGRLGETVMGKEGHEPMVLVAAAAMLSVGLIVAAAIS